MEHSYERSFKGNGKFRIYPPEVIETIDQRLCRLHSFGNLLTQLCQAETHALDPPSLADLGRVISEEADRLLNMIQDGNFA